MKFIIRAIQQGTDYEVWTGWAWVELEPEDVQRILGYRELFQMVKSKAGRVYEMYFWNHLAYFFEDGRFDLEELLTAAEQQTYEDTGFIRIPDEREALEGMFVEEADTPDGYDSTDCDQTVITDAGVSFYSNLDGCDASIRTSEVTFEALLLAGVK